MKVAKIAICLTMVLLLSSVIVTAAVGETSRPEPNVKGQVMDSSSGVPLMAAITFQGGDGTTKIDVRSDEKGYFALHLKDGEYRYITEARGYEPYTGAIKLGSDTPITMRIALKASEDGPVDNLYGSVHDAVSGSPLYAVIAIHLPDSIEPLMKLETDRSGQFSALLRPGEYLYHAESRDHESVKGRFRIPEEGVVKLPIRMSPLNGEMEHGIVHGVVMTRGESPLPGAEIVIFPLRPSSEREIAPIMTRTDEIGQFHLRIPFGAYSVEAHMEGFEPGHAEFRVTPEDPEVKVRMFMAPLEPPEPGDGIRIEFERIDRDSDGNPERVFLMVQLDMDPEPEVLYELIDKDSDGNPERVTFTMDVEPRLQGLIMMLVQMYLEKTPPFPDMPEYPDEPFHDGELPFLERIEDHLNADPAPEPLEEGADMDSEEKAQGPASDKTSRQDISGGLILGIGAVLILIGILGIAGFIAVRRNDE